MRWLNIILISLIALLTCTQVALAATSQDVTVTAVPDVVRQPTDLTATFINEQQVDLAWTPGSNADRTIVRAKFGSYPSGVSDGYEVYNAGGVVHSDTNMDFGWTFTEIHYRAWSWSDSHAEYSSNYAQDTVENEEMTETVQYMLQFGILFLLIFLAYRQHNAILYIISGMPCFFVGMTFMQTDLATALSLGILIMCLGFYQMVRAVILIFGKE